MVEKKGNVLLVGFHEWAWSRRTCGFPIYAIVRQPNGFEMRKIGSTTKLATKYVLPENTVAVVKKYVSNRGVREYDVYILAGDEIHRYGLYEENNFKPLEPPSGEAGEILEFVRKWIAESEVTDL